MLAYKISACEVCKIWGKPTEALTLNVLGDCGSSWPMRVEPWLHCMGIAWQVRGRCAGSAAHAPLRAIAAHGLSAACAIEPRPTHFACTPHLVSSALIAQSAHFAWVRTPCVGHIFCLGPHTLQPSHFVAHALISWSMPFANRSICYPSKSQVMQLKAYIILRPKFKIRTISLKC